MVLYQHKLKINKKNCILHDGIKKHNSFKTCYFVNLLSQLMPDFIGNVVSFSQPYLNPK